MNSGKLGLKSNWLKIGEFKTYTHTGPHPGLMEACKSIAMANPDLTKFYCIYLNSPETTAETDLKTKIILH